MNRNKKALLCFSIFSGFCWAALLAATYFNRQPNHTLPPENQKVYPLDKPTNIDTNNSFEDDAGKRGLFRVTDRNRYALTK